MRIVVGFFFPLFKQSQQCLTKFIIVQTGIRKQPDGSGKMMCATVNALCSSASGFIHFQLLLSWTKQILILLTCFSYLNLLS